SSLLPGDGGRPRRGPPDAAGHPVRAHIRGLAAAHVPAAARGGKAALDDPAAGRPLRRLHGPDHAPGGRADAGPPGGGPGGPMAAQPVVDRASFYISVSDRSKVSPVIYQYIVDHAEGHTPATILDTVRETFEQSLEAIRTTPPDTIGPGFFGPMRLDEFVATRLVETRVHGIDLTDALGEPPLHMPRTTTMAAEGLDEVLARRAVPGRPADREGNDLAFIRAAAGRGEYPDPRLPVVGERNRPRVTGGPGAEGPGS